MAKNKTKERVDATEFFTNSTTLTLKQVAAIVGVSPKQIGIWAKEDEWEIQRTAKQVTAGKIIAGYYAQIARLQKKINDEQDGIPTPAQTDQQNKLSDAIEKLKKKMNLSAYHMVLSEMLDDMNQNDTEKAKVFAPIMLDFLKKKANTLRDDS